MQEKGYSFLKSITLPTSIILVWECINWIFDAIFIKSTAFIVIPKPSTILITLGSIIFEPKVLQGLGQTLLTTLLGFSLGIIGAIVFGVLMGASRQVSAYISPTFHFLRSLPIVLYVPIALVLLSSDLRLPIVLSSFITILYGAIPVTRAVRDYDNEKILFLKARGFNRLTTTFYFILPEIVGALFTSIRITTTLALAVTVVAEMLLQSLGGLGAHIINTKETSQYSHLWALTFLLGLGGFIFQKAIIAIWRFAMPWAKIE